MRTSLGGAFVNLSVFNSAGFTFWGIVGGVPKSWTACSVAGILVYSDQQEAGKKGPVV